MRRFHINPNTGRVLRCYAGESGICWYGDKAIHGNTKAETQKLYEQAMKAATVPQVASVKELRKAPAIVLKNTDTKELNATQLAQTLRHEASELGMNAEVIDSAIDLATILHAHQKRGNRGNFTETPYIEHPLRNSLRLVRMGVKNQDVIVASILHDTIEDGAKVFVEKFQNNLTIGEEDARSELGSHIGRTYGNNVLELVEAVTNDYMTDTDKSNMSEEVKNLIYLEHVQENINKNSNVLLVKISDFIDNATGLHHNDVPARREKTKKQARKYLPVVEVFKSALKSSGLPEKQVTMLLSRMDTTKERLSSIISKDV